MNALVTSIVVSVSLLAIFLSIISLTLHWVRRTETPEFSALSRRLTETELSILNVLDQVKHWRGRDSVRKARQGAQDKLDAAEEGIPLGDYKSQLRRRARGQQTGADGE